MCYGVIPYAAPLTIAQISSQRGGYMAAFERILSGIPEMDKALDNIRLGDNVVWRVDNLSTF